MQFENSNEYDTFLFRSIVMTNDRNPYKIWNESFSELAYPYISHQIITIP